MLLSTSAKSWFSDPISLFGQKACSTEAIEFQLTTFMIFGLKLINIIWFERHHRARKKGKISHPAMS
jgi:hypothetical protein